MARLNVPLLSFNRGKVSPSALARVDIDRMRLSAEEMDNWIPKTQGPMRIRPGLGYLGSSLNDTGAQWIQFVAQTDDVAALELTHQTMRVWIDDAVLERTSVTTTITDFNTDTGAWKSGSSGGGGIGFGDTGLILDAGSRGGIAKATAKFNLGDTGQKNVEHAFAIQVGRGPVTFRVGNDTGDDSYVSESELREGYHNLAFTPTDTGGIHITFQTERDVDRIVTSIAMADTGQVNVPTPWVAADLDRIRYAQSADVVFVAAAGYRQRRIERRGTGRSWSVVKYYTDDGPFFPGRTADVRLKVGANTGNTTLTADRPFFDTGGHPGALFRLFHEGYDWEFQLGAGGAFTDPIRVTGTRGPAATGEPERTFTWTDTGDWVGTIYLQVSDDEEFGYRRASNEGAGTDDVGDTGNRSFTHEGKTNIDRDNLIEFFRAGFEADTGSYTSGVANVRMTYHGNGTHGIVRVTDVVSSTVANCEVLKAVSKTQYTDNWREGRWSSIRGFPTAVDLHEGRLWWSGLSRIFGSVSDAFHSFDEDKSGDAGPIVRVLGKGPVDNINFILSLQRMVIGTTGAEISVRSTSFDEPLTPTNMNVKESSSQGSRDGLPALRVDSRGIFVQRSGERVYQIVYDVDAQDYASQELTILHPDMARQNVVVDLAVQRQPDTRIHFVLSDGTAAILSFEPSEDLICWSTVSTKGTIEKVFVLPGSNEDQVYYHVNRTVNGTTKRFVEKWAMETQAEGDTGNRIADSFAVYSGASTLTPSGFDHLDGDTGVIVWADGAPVLNADGTPKNHTVSGGTITLATAAAEVIAGRGYTANYRSTKLAYAAQMGTALTQRKRLDSVAIIARNMHNKAIEYGGDTGDLTRLPDFYKGTSEADTIHSEYDIDASAVTGGWSTDSRLHLRARAPFPVELMAAIISVATHDRG